MHIYKYVQSCNIIHQQGLIGGTPWVLVGHRGYWWDTLGIGGTPWVLVGHPGYWWDTLGDGHRSDRDILVKNNKRLNVLMKCIFWLSYQ
jgi:hypothetical protein